MLTVIGTIIVLLLLWIGLELRRRTGLITPQIPKGFSVLKDGEVISVSRFQVVEATQFHLLDEAGEMRGMLSGTGGTASLVLAPKDGQPCVHIIVSSEGEPAVILSDSTGQSRLELRVMASSSVGSGMTLKDRSGTPMAAMVVQNDGHPQLLLWDKVTGDVAFQAP